MYRIQTIKPRSALRNVPVDVWRLIFGIIVSETSESRAKLHTALCLTHVCALWRTISTNAPELWTAVHLYTVNYTPKRGGQAFPNVDLLSLILQNSRKMPLTMEIAVLRALFAQSAVLETTRMFLREIQRAETIHLRYECLEEFFLRCTGNFFVEIFRPKMTGSPYLTNLSLDFRGSTSPSAYYMTHIWTPAPLLDSLSIYNDILDLDNIRSFHDTKFPFRQLTNLTVTSQLEVRGLFLILSWATSLVVGKFLLLYGHIPSSRDFYLPDLRKLELQGQGYGRSAGYELEVRISACQITHLHLDLVGSDPEERLGCLKLLPFIHVLDIRAASVRIGGRHEKFGREISEALRERHAETGEFLIPISPILWKIDGGICLFLKSPFTEQKILAGNFRISAN